MTEDRLFVVGVIIVSLLLAAGLIYTVMTPIHNMGL